MAAEMVDGLQMGTRAEVDTRDDQAALEIDVEGRHKKGGARVSATSSILSCCCYSQAVAFFLVPIFIRTYTRCLHLLIIS